MIETLFIDILVVYTRELENIVGANMPAYVESAFPLNNVVLENNNLPYRLRLVGTNVIDRVEVGGATAGYDGQCIMQGLVGCEGVPAARDATGADVVVFISQRLQYVGYASPLFHNTIATGGLPEFAFASVRTDGWQTPYVLMHEIAHVAGIMHYANELIPTDMQGAYAFSSKNPVFSTIPAWGNPTGTIPYFSSKARLTPEGWSLTDGVSDSEAVLRVTLPVIANYRAEVAPGC